MADAAPFTFAGIDSATLLHVLGVRRTVLPFQRDVYESIPGRAGTYQFPEELGDRPVLVSAGLIGTSQGNLIAQERAVAEWLRTRTRERLIFDDDPDWYFMAKVANEAAVTDSLDLGGFEIEFRCDPYVYALNEGSPSAALGASFTFDSDYAPDVPPRIVVYAVTDLTSPSVTLDGTTIGYAGILPAGDALVWDSVDFWSLLYDDGTEGTDVRDGAFDPTLGDPVEPEGDFPTITQGANVVTSEAVSGTGTVVVFWRPRRL